MVKRFIGSGRMQEGGFLATHKMDHNAHVTGGDFRHGALDIDMEPIIQAFAGANVQKTLEAIAAFLSAQGSGFVSIGKADGYDGYAAGVYNVGAPSTPTLDDAFTAAFADPRLVNGGIILLLAGTYELLTTVEVPPGITIMGELAGSIIIGHTIENSMFKILQGTENTRIGGDSGPGEIRLEAGEPLDATTFWNLILADNLDGYVQSGGQPIATMQTVPMIECEKSSNFVCKDVRFIGRVNNGPESGRGKTLQAIGGYTTGGATSTQLTLQRCFFDGMQIGINFIPGGGDIDHLTIDKCRARTFGTETGIFASINENCFVNMSLCHATLTNNYFVGFGSAPTQGVKGFFVVETATGGTDVNVIVTGNTGNLSAGLSLALSKDIYNNDVGGGLALKAMISGNNFGSNLHSQWFVVVTDGSSSAGGDFSGSTALDLVLDSSIFSAPTTVLVGEGIYTVTRNGLSNINYISTSGGTHPQIHLNLGAGAPTNEASHRVFLTGAILKGIEFRAAAAATAYHAVQPRTGLTLNAAAVDNCFFRDCCLYAPQIAAGLRKQALAIMSCQFEQTGAFDDNLGLLLPVLDQILMDNCYFLDGGYVGLIGEDAGIGYTATAVYDSPTVTIRNCVMDLTGSSIDDDAPLTAPYAYLTIDSTEDVAVYMQNTKIMARNDLSEDASVIGAGLTDDFRRFVFIDAERVYIDNCLFHGPDQIYNPAVTDFPMPIVHIEPEHTLRLTNSIFKRGGMSLIVGGTTDSIDGIQADGVYIDNCTFDFADGSSRSVTLVDIELNPSTQPNNGTVSVTNCNFFVNNVVNGPLRSEHGLITGTDYDAIGMLQIYAMDYHVLVDNNSMHGDIPQGIPTDVDHMSMLMINTNLGPGVSANTLTPLRVSNNYIVCNNEYTSVTASESATVTYLRGMAMQVHDNFLTMRNVAAGMSSYIGCLLVDTRDNSGGATPEPAWITDNIFSRRNAAGIALDMNGGYIQLPSTNTADGHIVDNAYSDASPLAGSTTTVDDNTTGTVFWNITRNKNQTATIELRGAVGTATAQNDTVNSTIVNGSSIEVRNRNPRLALTQEHLFIYDNLDGAITYQWHIPLHEVLPEGVQLISISCTRNISSGTPPATTNTLVFDLYDNTNDESSGGFTPGAPLITNSYNAISTYRNTPDAAAAATIRWEANGAATAILAITAADLTYRW